MREMSFSLETETQIYLLSVLLGAGIGVVYDMFRAVRIIFRHKKAAVFAEDIIFCALAGFAVFTFATGLTGKLRFFTVAGMAAGFVIEHFSLGNLAMFLLRRITSAIKRFFVTPAVEFIHKIGQKIIPGFVKNHIIFKNNKKISQKPLKVDF